MPFIRLLLPGDASRLAAHLKRLDSDARRLRFCSYQSDDAIDHYVREIEWLRSLHLAAFQESEIRAACQLSWRDPLWPSSAELAISVEGPERDHGLGSELIRRTLIAARNRGIRHVTMVCLPENAKMRHIALKFDSMLELVEGDVSARIDLHHPDHLSFLEELLDEGEAAIRVLAESWGAGAQLTFSDAVAARGGSRRK